MRKKVLFPAIIVMVMAMMVFLLLELALRMIPGYSRNNLIFQDTAGFRIAIYEPNSELWNLKEKKNLMKFNDMGFHDIRQSHEKKPNEKVIAFIGDSFVECAQVETDSMFSSLLRRKLEKNGGYKVYSFGVSGTGTAYQYALYNYSIKPRVKVDELYLCIFLGNDIDDNNPFTPTHPNGYFVVDSARLIKQIWKDEGVFKKVATWMRKKSYLANTIYDMAFRYKRRKVHRDMANTRSNLPKTEGNMLARAKGDTLMVDYSINLIKHWQAELRQEGIRMHLVFWDPDLFMDDWQKKLMYDKTRDFARDNGMKVISVNMRDNERTHFIHKDGEKDVLGHYNTYGYREVAELLYNEIADTAPSMH